MKAVLLPFMLMTGMLIRGAAWSADPEKQLQAAVYREVVSGDLAGAMEMYQSLVNQPGIPRGVSARAILQIGLCQERAGHREEAYETFRRVVADYSDQTQIASLARVRLAAWSGPRNLKFTEGVGGKVPPGWFVPSLPKDADYVAELRRDGCRSKAGCAVVLVPGNVPHAVGNLMQSFSAASYVGKTVRLRAWLRLETFFVIAVGVRVPNPEDRAQIWMNVERANRRNSFADNMDDRPVRSPEWTQREIVADIGEDARFINLGVMSIGGGRVWVDDVSFDVISRAR